jgi:hypothetical protein
LPTIHLPTRPFQKIHHLAMVATAGREKADFSSNLASGFPSKFGSRNGLHMPMATLWKDFPVGANGENNAWHSID